MFDLSAFQGTAFWTPMGMGDAWLKAAGRLQVEAVALMTRRLMARLEFPQSLAQCETPLEVLAEQIRFMQVAQRQYAQSLETMTSVLASAAPAIAVADAPRARDYMTVADKPAPAGADAGVAAASRAGAKRGERPLYKKSA